MFVSDADIREAGYEVVVRLRKTTMGGGFMGIVQSKESGNVFFLKSVIGRRGPRELRIMRKLGHHENVASFVDQINGNDGSPKYLVSEYCPGLSLEEFSRYLVTIQEERWRKKFRRDFLLALVRGVRFLHSRGVIHGDIKPHNVVVDWSPDAVDKKGIVMTSLKIIDFDSSIEHQSLETPIPLEAMGYVGTIGCMSPEMHSRMAQIERRTGAVSPVESGTSGLSFWETQNISCEFTATTDIWSIGMTFFVVTLHLEDAARPSESTPSSASLKSSSSRQPEEDADFRMSSGPLSPPRDDGPIAPARADEGAQRSAGGPSDSVSGRGSEGVSSSSEACWEQVHEALSTYFVGSGLAWNPEKLSYFKETIAHEEDELFVMSKIFKLDPLERWSAATLHTSLLRAAGRLPELSVDQSKRDSDSSKSNESDGVSVGVSVNN